MKPALARLLPDGLAARFALLLVVALVAANLVAFLVLSHERARLGREAREDQEIERIVALVPVLEAVDASLRRSIARNASTKVARVGVDSGPIVAGTRPDARSRALSDRLAASLGPREIRVAIFEQGPPRGKSGNGPDENGHHRSEKDEHHPSRDGREIIAISIALSRAVDRPDTEAWLNVTTRGDGGRSGGGVEEEVFALILALSLAAVLGVGLLFVRHLTRPLSRLADAARAAGRGDRSARVPERGAREMREAAVAFNAMQGQIARFDAERTRTMGAVGHDLRTPITSLRIRAEMLDEAVREPMVRTLDEMTVMADGLVAFARGHGEAEERQRIDLGELLGRLCEERGATFGAGDGAIAVAGRPVALTRAIGNLIDNAIRYGKAASVHLSAEEGEALIRIEDDGPGIAPERLSAVFEPFVRGEESRSAETGGAGLGLSIARSIVQAHGGSIELDNRPRGGLRASVRLPLEG